MSVRLSLSTTLCVLAAAIVAPHSDAQFTAWVNATAASGISYPAPAPGLGNGFGRGVAWGDFDADGDVDLFAPGGNLNPIRVWWNNGLGAFTFTTLAPSQPRSDHGTAAADFDNDGDIDVYLCQGYLTGSLVAPANRLYVNQGNGTFIEAAAAAGVAQAGTGDSYCCSWGDYDRDGFLDLYVGGYYTNVPGQTVAPHTLFRNNGNGTFTDVTIASGTAEPGFALAVFWHDYNEDGWPDLHLINDRGGTYTPNGLLRNNRNGTFTNVAASVNANCGIDAMGITVGDIHNDGDWDAFVTNFAAGHVLHVWNANNQTYLLPGSNFYTMATNYGLNTGQLGWGCHFMDFDNDGWNDLFVMHQTPPNRMFRNTGLGPPFADVTAALGFTASNFMPWGRSASVADYDNDGWLDIFIPTEFTTGYLFRNPGQGSGRWLEVKTVGTVSNRDGIGTTIIAKSGSAVRRRRIVSAEGYLGDGDKRAHFGCGGDLTVNELELRWPSGTVQYVPGVATNQAVTITEPNFTVTGPLTPGSANTISTTFAADSGLAYVCGFALNAAAELYLPDQRAIRVDVADPMLLLTTSFGNPILGFYAGILPASGTATMTFNVPGIPALTGLSGWMIGVTLQPTYPAGIKSITGPQKITIL